MRRTLLLLIALLATAGFVAGCGTSGGNDDADTTTTTAAAGGGADTTEPEAGEGDETTTTEASDDEGEIEGADVSELEALLPTEEDLGDGWTANDADSGEDDASGDAEDPMDQQFKDACPGLEELSFLDLSSVDEGDTASISFSDADDRELSVELDASSEQFTEDNIDALVAAFDDCGEISLTDEDGTAYDVSISAERDGSRGDFGLRLDMNLSLDFLGTAIEVDLAGVAFSVDGVSAFISSTSGIAADSQDFEKVPFDEALLGDLADLMENRLNDR